MHQEFIIKDSGQANFFLEIELMYIDQGILVSHHKYIIGILQEANMMKIISNDTPLHMQCKLTKADGNVLDKPIKYKGVIGRMLHLIVTRPYITIALQ